MRRLVFFGMDGAFSVVALRALKVSGLTPSLVVIGKEREKNEGILVESHPQSARWLPRFVQTRPSEEPSDLLRIAKEFGVDALTTNQVNDYACRVRIAETRPELLLIAGFPQLLSKEVLALANNAGLNLHPGRLPEERGPMPWFWAFKRGATTLHYTIHVLDAGEDTGDIVQSGEVAIPSGTPAPDALRALAVAATPAWVKATRAFLEGDLVRAPQNRDRAQRQNRPNFRDGLIDASRTGAEIFTFVSACAKTHSLFVEVGGDRFFIAQAVRNDTSKLPHDYVLLGDNLLLACSDGFIELELKEEGALFASEYQESVSR